MRILIGSLLVGIMLSTILVMVSEKAVSPALLGSVLLSALGLIILFIASLRSKTVSKGSESEFMMETLRELIAQMKDRHIELDIFNENILQSVPSGVMSINRDGVITKINEAGKVILNKDDITGRHVTEVIGEPLLGYIKSCDTLKREEVLCDISGKKIWLGFSISPLKDRNKNIIGKIIIFTDITEFKELQSRLKLRDRLEGLAVMASGIAHELRNPMAVITGYASMLLKKADPSIQPIVEAIQKEINLMDGIVRDFLTFARYEEPSPVDVNMEALLKEVIDSFHLPASIELSVRIEPSQGLRADETLLKQAIKNLIQNSLEAMPSGGILKITGERSGDSYRLTITDTGTGIAPEIREKIFMPFFTTKERGTGLGLAIVHKVITAHGGEITFDSSEKGTTFTILLPYG